MRNFPVYNLMRQTDFTDNYGYSKQHIQELFKKGALDFRIKNRIKHIDMDGKNTKELIKKLGRKKYKTITPKSKAKKVVEKDRILKNSEAIETAKKELESLNGGKKIKYEKLEDQKIQLACRKLQIECDEKEGLLINRSFVKQHVFGFLDAMLTNVLGIPGEIELEYRTALKNKEPSGVLKKILTKPIEDAIKEAKTKMQRELKK